MKIEIYALLAGAVALSIFTFYKQHSLIKKIGNRELRWRSGGAKIMLALFSAFFVAMAILVFYKEPDPIFIAAIIALIPVYVYRPASYEIIGDKGLLFRQGKSFIGWNQIKDWSITNKNSLFFLTIMYTRANDEERTDQLALLIPLQLKPQIEMCFRKHIKEKSL